METMTTKEAWIYIREKLGKPVNPYHRRQMDRYREYGQIKPHVQGMRGQQNIFLVADLDDLIATIKAS